MSMRKKTIGSAAFVMAVMALAAVLVLTSRADPDALGEADAVIRMDAEGRPDAPFQYGAFVWLAEDQVLVKTDSGDLRSIAGPDGQALAELVRRQIAPYGQPRTDG